MSPLSPGWLAFPLGSLPGADPKAAWAAVLKHFPSIPGWPQLPQRHAREGMYAQFADGFPGVRFDGQHVQVDRGAGVASQLEALYLAYLEDDLAFGRLGGTNAAALEALRQPLEDGERDDRIEGRGDGRGVLVEPIGRRLLRGDRPPAGGQGEFLGLVVGHDRRPGSVDGVTAV